MKSFKKKGVIYYWKRLYGINRKSPLSSVMDVTLCLPHVTMHISIEEALLIHCRLVLKRCILDKKLFTIDKFHVVLVMPLYLTD